MSTTLRKKLDLFANIRPAGTRPGLVDVAGHYYLVIVRENTEGVYTD